MNFLDLKFHAALIGERRELPPFLGPTLRGAFGSLLKRSVCQVAHGRCDRCLLKNVCPYTVMFEGMPPEDRTLMRKYPRIPQPFILEVPWDDGRCPDVSSLTWTIRLFGGSVRYWPYVIHVIRTAVEAGIGQRHVRSKLLSVSDGLDGPSFWSGDEVEWREPRVQLISTESSELPDQCTLRWRFLTPVQIVRDGSPIGAQLDGLDLLLAGRRRWGVMNSFYGTPLDSTDIPPARFDRSDFKTISSRLRHWNISRYSGRQERRVELHGVVGEIVIDGPWGLTGDWLSTIPKLHLGKSVSFGLGEVEWELLQNVGRPRISDAIPACIESPTSD